MTTCTLITGASSGMGRATAIHFSKDRDIILCGRNLERLQETEAACKQYGRQIFVFPFDFRDASAVGVQLSNFIREKKIQIDSFLHFAGVTDIGAFKNIQYEVGLSTMNTNFFAPLEILKVLVRRRVNSNALKRVVLTSSVLCYSVRPFQAYYIASKAALEAACRALATELAPININVIAPGSFNTNITRTSLFGENSSDFCFRPVTLLPVGGLEEIVKVASFLVSEQSKYVTGQTIYVDGGERFCLAALEKVL